MKILIFGLPRQGKTVLAEKLAKELNAVHFNADYVRQHINTDLGFSYNDRVTQASRMGAMCDIVTQANIPAIADFVCPTEETRAVFNATYLIWVNTGQPQPHIDTQVMFKEPSEYHLKIIDWEYSIKKIAADIRLYHSLNFRPASLNFPIC